MLTVFFLQSGFHIPITPLLLFVFYFLILAIWGTYSVIVRYHWKSYGAKKAEVLTMNFYYFLGSALLLGLTGFFVFAYYLSS
jgi:hypothetical protein